MTDTEKAMALRLIPILMDRIKASAPTNGKHPKPTEPATFSDFSDDSAVGLNTFSAEDLDKFHDYYGPDSDGHYNGNLHRAFKVGMKAFADKLGMRRIGAVVDGKPSWVWKAREKAKEEGDTFSDDDPDTFAFESGKHPRDDGGRFISGGHLKEAQANPEKAEELRRQVTRPKERAKLDAVLEKAHAPLSHQESRDAANSTALTMTRNDDAGQCIFHTSHGDVSIPSGQIDKMTGRVRPTGENHTTGINRPPSSVHMIRSVPRDPLYVPQVREAIANRLQIGEYDPGTPEQQREREEKRADEQRHTHYGETIKALGLPEDRTQFHVKQLEKANSPREKTAALTAALKEHNASHESRGFSDAPDTFSDTDADGTVSFSDSQIACMAAMFDEEPQEFADRSHLVLKEVRPGIKRWTNPNAAKQAEERKAKGEAFRKEHEGRTPREHLEHTKREAEPKRAAARAAFEKVKDTPKLWSAGDVDRMQAHLDTLPRDELRTLAKSVAKKVGGLKMDLVKRLLDHVGAKVDPALDMAGLLEHEGTETPGTRGREPADSMKQRVDAALPIREPEPQTKPGKSPESPVTGVDKDSTPVNVTSVEPSKPGGDKTEGGKMEAKGTPVTRELRIPSGVKDSYQGKNHELIEQLPTIKHPKGGSLTVQVLRTPVTDEAKNSQVEFWKKANGRSPESQEDWNDIAERLRNARGMGLSRVVVRMQRPDGGIIDRLVSDHDSLDSAKSVAQAEQHRIEEQVKEVAK